MRLTLNAKNEALHNLTHVEIRRAIKLGLYLPHSSFKLRGTNEARIKKTLK